MKCLHYHNATGCGPKALQKI